MQLTKLLLQLSILSVQLLLGVFESFALLLELLLQDIAFVGNSLQLIGTVFKDILFDALKLLLIHGSLVIKLVLDLVDLALKELNRLLAESLVSTVFKLSLLGFILCIRELLLCDLELLFELVSLVFEVFICLC